MPTTLPHPNQPPSRDTFPRAVILAAGFGLVLAIAGAWVGTRTGPAAIPPPAGHQLASRDLGFQDQPDGSVSVHDAGAGNAEIARIEPGTGAFIRATLRGLVRQRRMDGHGPEAPFRLTAWSDGRMTLQDQATGRLIEIVAFGPTQTEAFARLLQTRRDAQ